MRAFFPEGITLRRAGWFDKRERRKMKRRERLYHRDRNEVHGGRGEERWGGEEARWSGSSLLVINWEGFFHRNIEEEEENRV